MKNFSKLPERFFVVLFSGLVSFLVVFPQIWAVLKTPTGYFFTGVNAWVNSADIQGVYLAAIRNFSENGIFYQNPFNYTSQEFIFHYPVYLILGKIVSFFSFPVELVYHLAAFLLSFIFLLFVFGFLKLFFDHFFERIFALVLVLFGGLYSFPVPEGVGLFSLTIPHFALAQLALFVCLYFLLKVSDKKPVPFSNYLILFLASLVLFAIHAWMAVFLLLLNLLWLLFLIFTKRKAFPVFLTFFIFLSTASPFAIYYAVILKIPEGFYPMLTPKLTPFLLYGGLFPLGIIGLIRSLKGMAGINFAFLSFWFVVQLLAIYLPFSFQRRLVEGFYLPLAVFSTLVLAWLIKFFNLGKLKFFVYFYSLFFLCLGVLANYLFLFLWLPNNLVFRRNEEREAAKYLNQQADLSKIVFSLAETGNFLAGQANVKVFVGHFAQTPNFLKNSEIARSYYLGIFNQGERGQILAKNNICYLYLGGQEQRITKVDFEKEDYLEKVFQKGLVTIYKTSWCQRGSDIAGKDFDKATWLVSKKPVIY